MKTGFRLWFDEIRNMRIKAKLFLLITITMAVSSSISLVGLQIAFSMYDQQIYEKSSQVLNLSSTLIENELNKVERLTFSIMSDEQIQQHLIVMNSNESDYIRIQSRAKLVDRLVQYINSETYISAADITDVMGNSYSSGNLTTLSPERKALIQETSDRGAGSLGWVNPDEQDYSLIATRQIRSSDNLELKKLGSLVLHVNLDKMVNQYAREAVTRDGELIIVSKGTLVYPRSVSMKSLISENSPVGASVRGFRIIEQDGEKYFVSHIHSDYLGWTYYNTLPFQTIFYNLTLMKNWMIAAFLISFFLLVGFGMAVARSVTRPIEGLISNMRGLQIGDLENSELPPIAPISQQMDEVGLLQRTYRMMIVRIQELIKENYTKQLIIKETEFRSLQAQINPHFLYNTLESINWISKMNGQQQVSQMVESLGYLLRSSISLKQDMIPIEDELKLVQHYITIQKVRFEERLDFRLDVPAALRAHCIPKLTLQPLLENAIKYAVEVMLEPCIIHIWGREEGDAVFLIVEDNGPGIDEAYLEKILTGERQSKGTGIGLKNIDERIKLTFGEEFGIQVENRTDGGARITIRIPMTKRG
ncbi:sensor histidine kinase [Paenibacillus chondroitinus]|uniref:histidine kinase n=1 Tax=Paenibacillus chondroitinus TaxID=59842 RepID=A0ABU6DH06_9BACL|nr:MULTISPECIES: sensor histidine kinase [Paenibacillus]MCY9658542.1 sensor histidine kinase [Paenibacillus anseongense]MEB4796233.1 sensor histidine kinase [Paenibacillus chondroitinus]